jgi:hypothetical protein
VGVALGIKVGVAVAGNQSTVGVGMTVSVTVGVGGSDSGVPNPLHPDSIISATNVKIQSIVYW